MRFEENLMYECMFLSFFRPWGLIINLFCNRDKRQNAKQNTLQNPRKMFKIYIAYMTGKTPNYWGNFNSKTVHLNTNYMNICKVINVPKRSRKIFAMQGKTGLGCAN